MRCLSLMLIVSFFIACQPNDKELIGHWHMEFVGSTDELEYYVEEFFTVDIVNDSFAYKNLYNKNHLKFPYFLNHEKQLISIAIECFNENYNYQLENKKLFFTTNTTNDIDIEKEFDYLDWIGKSDTTKEVIPVAAEEGIDFIEKEIMFFYEGTKHDVTTCNKQTAYYQDFPIKINLPIYPLLDLDTLSYNYFKYFSGRELYFGKVKPNRGLNTGDSTIVFAHSNKRIITNDLELQEEMDEILECRDDTKTKILIIESDQSTLLCELIPYIDFYKNKNRNLIYFAVRSEDVYTNFQVKYKVVNARAVDWKSVEDLTIQAWLSQL